MVPDVRSSASANFDLNSPTGMLAVLGAIRASSVAVDVRNELRDLVFLYSNGGHDPAVLGVLQERLSAEGIVIEPLPTAGTSGDGATALYPKSGFAGGRPTPKFTAASVPVESGALKNVPAAIPSIKSEPAVAPAPQAVLPVTPLTTPEVVVTPVPVTVEPPLPRPPVIVPVPGKIPQSTPTPVSPSPTPTSPIIPAPPVTVPANVAPVIENSAETNPGTAGRLERIRLIKSDVNDRVGNPVNLVNMNKALGSEYMSALLEAMKLLSSATDGESDRAMDRLEAAYLGVKDFLTRNETPTLVPVSPSHEPTDPAPTPIVPESNLAALSRLVEPKEVPSWGNADSVDTAVTTPLRVRSVASLASQTQLPSNNAAQPVPEPPAPQQSVAAASAPLRSLHDLPTAAEVNSAGAQGDPLTTKEVDDGLQQLLSEWTIFKKSGLFGTGPNGRTHPLFIKIAPLTVPLILAGRFEGATQEIKQSITDYMNGWRYEQGIVYEKEEPFERYLRRVIRHIIDLQNSKRRS